MEDGEPVPGSLFVYAPNKIAPAVFAALFAASAVGHFWQCFRYKCFKIIGLHPVCAALFALGYALREVAAFNYTYLTSVGQLNHTNLIIYVLSQVFIFVAPPLLELANYHVLGRILYYVPYLAPYPPGRVLSTFGLLMTIVETLNAIGVALASNPTGHSQHMGSRMIVAALSMQLAVIVIFVVLAATFHRRCARANIRTRAVTTSLDTLYISMVLILIRCIYRLVEHLGNTDIELDNPDALKALTPVLRYEWYFYAFEATLMVTNSVLWNVWNPGRYLPRNYHVYLAKDGTTEVESEDSKDARTLLAKTGNALTFGCLFRKRDNREFWELNGHLVDGRQA